MGSITFSFSKTNSQAFTETDLATIISELETFFNSTGIDADNIIDASLPLAVLKASEFVDQDTLVFGQSGVTVRRLNDDSYSTSGISNISIGIGSLSRASLAAYDLVDSGSTATAQQVYSQIVVSGPSTTASITTNAHCPIFYFQATSENIPSRDDIELTIDGSVFGGATLDVNDFKMPMVWIDADNLLSSDIDEAKPTATYTLDGSSSDGGIIHIFDGGY